MLTSAQRVAGLEASASRSPPPAQRALRLPARCRRSVQNAVLARGVPVGVVAEQQEDRVLELPLPRAVENAADDPNLHNPLERMERLSTGWFGVITEFEGVLVEDTTDAHVQAWLQVADEFAYPRPLGQTLRRIKGVRDEVLVAHLFHWTRSPAAAASAARRKAEVYDQLMGGRQPPPIPHSGEFLATLANFKVPLALATAAPEALVRPALERLGLSSAFGAVVTGEDSGAPEVEYYYMLAAHQLQRPFVRCVVVGDSNRSVEAAHELGMKSVVVAGASTPTWNYGGADLVVRSLSQLSFVNLKRLFGEEALVEAQLPEPEGSVSDRRAGSSDGDSYLSDVSSTGWF